MGVQARLNLIGNEYCLEQVKNVKEGVFVDIGSNIGEFTLRAHQLFPAVSFVRFEPSKNENLASSKNLVGVNQILIEKPLWSSVTSMKFYNQNETGDSSLFQPTNDAEFEEIETSTLDIEISKLNIKRIELLKLEAEGAEPEILQGGKETLKITQMITADLGPERGIGQERTFDQVNDLLTEAGFVLVGRNSGNRECYLYERANR
jgi:FkbM family methyltransferase